MYRRHLIAAALAASVSFVTPALAQDKSIVVASTTSTQDSGLFGHILPLFKAKTGIDVKVIAQGTGQALDTGRLGIAIQAVGIARRALEHALAYCAERKQFGKALREFEAVQFKLADMATRIEAARSVRRATSSSWAWRWTSSRDPAEQVCPAFWKMALATPCTVRSRSASANTMFGDLPPSSMTTGTTLSAAIFATAMPTDTDPVKVS